MPDQIYSVTWNGKEKVSYVYDGLGRLTTKNIGSFVPVIVMRMLVKIKQQLLLNQWQPLQKHIHTLMITSAIRLIHIWCSIICVIIVLIIQLFCRMIQVICLNGQ